MVKTWKFAVVTQKGIYLGQVIGKQEEGETDQQALEEVSNVILDQCPQLNIKDILACFVSDGELYVHAHPDTIDFVLNIELDYLKEEQHETDN